jgi:branched-chain amino acid transport system substrate-binding protein
MWNRVFLAACLAASSFSVACGAAMADETVKFGVVGPMTGPFAVMGDNWRQGIEAYVAQHGDTFGGRQIEVIYRDTGADARKAKQLVQELVVRDKVSFIGGFGLTPEAAASAPVVNQAKIPAFLFHTASPSLMIDSPYYVRMGQNIATNAEVAASWALKNNKKTAYIAVADYAPGIIVLDAFKKYFEAHGGKIVGEDRIPLNTVDFSPFAERIAAAKPDVLPMFIPPGAPAVGFVKALAARGVMKETTVIGEGEAEDPDLHLFDDSVKGFHSSIYYSSTEDTPENKAFLAALKGKFGPKALPSTFTIGAYDSVGVIAMLLKKEAGQPLNGPKEMELLKGYSWISPRGKVTLDPKTREPIEDFMIREVNPVKGGGYRNVIIDTIPQVNPATFAAGG